MKATFNRKQVLEKLAVVQKAINSRAVLPILSGVKWEFVEDGIRLSATDLSVWLSAFVEAEVSETGEIVLPKTVNEWLSKDNSEFIEITGKGERVSMTRVGKRGEGGKFAGMDAEEFPLMGDDFDNSYEIDAEELSELGARSAYVASTDNNLTSAARMVADGGKLVVYAINGFKGLSKYESPTDAQFDLVVRAKDFKDVSGLFDGTVVMSPSGSKIRFSDGRVVAVLNTLEGQLADYKSFASRRPISSLVVDSREIVSAISTVRIASSPAQVKGGGDGIRQIRMKSSRGGLIVSSVGGGESSDEVVLDAEMHGEFDFVYNSDYLTEHASKVRGSLKIGFLDQGIAMFTDTKDSAWLGMTPPMRG